MLNSTILTGAYGRKYDTPEAAMKDWQDGKDFRIIDGPYCSIRDVAYFKSDMSIVGIRLTNGQIFYPKA